jgi:hypothetical protein
MDPTAAPVNDMNIDAEDVKMLVLDGIVMGATVSLNIIIYHFKKKLIIYIYNI